MGGFRAASQLDVHLNEHRSDIVYRAKLWKKEDQWVYLLFEHKRNKDKKIHKKLIPYMIDIWDQLEKQNLLI
jgi:hypothetical protein